MTSVSQLYLRFMGIVLIGYAIFDKGFAYIGVAPIYIGEIALLLGLCCALIGGVSSRVFGSPITWMMLLFGSWELMRLVPYVDTYGLLAIRDSVLWLYMLFALLVAGALLKGRNFGQVPVWFAAWCPWYLVLSPIVFFLFEKYMMVLPRMPGSNVPIFYMKGGDMSVHLAGTATFLGLGLHRHFSKTFKTDSHLAQLKEFALWMLLGIDVITAGSRNRGGFLSVIVACSVMLLFRPMNRLNRFILPALVIVAVSLVFDVRVPVGGDRDVSVQQIIDNLQSVISKTDKDYLKETESWRLEWWHRIEADTFNGPYFWFGKGYGVNLASIQGYDDGTGNRSPHNAHLNVLARSGVPGLLLWLVFIVTVGYNLTKGFFRATAARHDVMAKLNLWALTYWLAYLVNSSFDVYLEGPQGGIWFWCVTGFAIVLNLEQPYVIGRPQTTRSVGRRAPAQG